MHVLGTLRFTLRDTLTFLNLVTFSFIDLCFGLVIVFFRSMVFSSHSTWTDS